MKMKRIMALVMTSAMVMGTLAGCGASTDTTDTTQSQSENNSTAAAATTETASEEKRVVRNRGWQDSYFTVLGRYPAGIRIR